MSGQVHSPDRILIHKAISARNSLEKLLLRQTMVDTNRDQPGVSYTYTIEVFFNPKARSPHPARTLCDRVAFASTWAVVRT